MSAALIGGMIAPVIGGLIGHEAGRGDRERQERELEAALAAITSLQIPDIEKQKLMLELPQLQGTYNPQMEQFFNLGPSAMEGVQVDPQFEDAQIAALKSLQDIGKEGMTASEKAILNQIRRQTAQEEQARQGQIMQNMQERGAGGSGMELAARLSSSQKAADRASVESDRLAAMAQQRAMEAIQQAGSQAGNIRRQDFGEQSDVARAKDVINQFNTSNRQSLESRNINAANQAQQANLREAQRIADQQAATRNSQQTYNKELQQKQFENEFRKAQAVATARAGMSNYYGGRADETGQMWSQIGNTGGKMINALGAPSAPQPQPVAKPQATTFATQMNTALNKPAAYTSDEDDLNAWRQS